MKRRFYLNLSIAPTADLAKLQCSAALFLRALCDVDEFFLDSTPSISASLPVHQCTHAESRSARATGPTQLQHVHCTESLGTKYKTSIFDVGLSHCQQGSMYLGQSLLPNVLMSSLLFAEF